MQGRKYSQPIPYLNACYFSPSLHTRRHRLVHWELPPSDKLKLNVDASVGRFNAAAGTVLRNDHGDFVSAICFSLPTTLPLWAALMALLYALIFYARDYDHLILETDCRLLLSHLSAP